MRSRLVIAILFAVIVALGLFSFGTLRQHRSGEGESPATRPASQPASRPALAGGDAGVSGGDTSAHVEETGYWTCGMHPQVKMDAPGPCPVCGMELYFRNVSDPGVIEVTEDLRRLIGIVTVPVEMTTESRDVRTVGRVEINERELKHVHSRVQGWIEKLHVDFEGDRVRKGAPLLTVYSPELLATQEEFLLAVEAAEKIGSSPDPDAQKHAELLVDAARRRLVLLDVPRGEIERLERTKKSSRSVELRASVSGFVTEIVARQGMEISPSMVLYSIADLTTVWITADVYENEMASVKKGTEAEVTLRQLPGRKLNGRIDYIFPILSEKTRTNRVRMTMRNENFLLRPGMFGDVVLKGAARRNLTIPLDAVSRTGIRDVVFVEIAPGRFSAREVVIGEQFGDRYAVLDGLEAGEMVVAESNYFLDSEASIRGTIEAGGAGHRH